MADARKKLPGVSLFDADKRTVYEVYFAEEFLDAFDSKFSCGLIVFDEFKRILRDDIDRLVNDRIGNGGTARLMKACERPPRLMLSQTCR